MRRVIASGSAGSAVEAAPVLELGHPSLRAICAPIGPLAGMSASQRAQLDADAARLQATLAAFRAARGFGRAIAAPQIGVRRRMVAMDLGTAAYPDRDRGPLLLLDPELTWRSTETFTLWDDCMSFPWLLVRVRRHISVSLRFHDEAGAERRWERVPRALAELLQHELDHLDGVLALDRAEPAAPGLDAVIARSAFDAERSRFRAQVEYAIGEE
ncbi:MAG TPA: peptide deformylase [Thermoanaerobaculia bacterium]|jgi:peptide deformylase|nr:peptide deformylase [Thermoanaerobaculia bacterium]